jgi:hypothetical protein
MSWIAGIDVGGTFTDLIALDTASGAVRLAKVPTTPENQAYGVLAALDEAKVALGELALIVHGTTTTTNALLEGSWPDRPHHARFRDVLSSAAARVAALRSRRFGLSSRASCAGALSAWTRGRR